MPAGFFFSSMGSGRTEPNGLVILLWTGALVLAAGLILLGVSLLRGPGATAAPAAGVGRHDG
jgi:hypothetical protein